MMLTDPVHNTQQAVLPDSLQALLDELERQQSCDPARAASLLCALDISADDLKPWYDFGHPARDSYGRLLVHAGANYELMVMSWSPGDYSAIHDHGEAEWGAVRYFGNADHAVFEINDKQLKLRQRMTMQVGEVCAVAHDLIHLMGNATSQPFVSLHLYGRSQPAASITGGARIFDLCERRIQRTDGGVFFCLPESDIDRREDCPAAAPTTELLHHQLMLARLQRMAAGGIMDTGLKARIPRLQAAIAQLGVPGTTGI